nr:MerR family transcriptional regulator [Micromonospora sp. DSM 115978]
MGDDGLSAGAVARRLGVAVTTLRTWHQRYGLGPSRHVPGHHRRYTPADLARLEIMRRLTADGISPAEAARWARHGPDASAVAVSGRDGGGATIPVGRAGPAARGLARAAMRMDAAGMIAAIELAIAAGGVVGAWDTVLRPVLAGIGERHAGTAGLIEVEHLLSRAVSEVFATVTRLPAGREPPRILLTCADEEQHTLPLEALAAALAEAGVGCRLLGARVPSAALVEAVNRTGPTAVVVWSHARSTGDPGQLAALFTSRWRPPLVLAAGPGWPAGVLGGPAGVIRPAGLAEAVVLLLAALEPARRSTAS